MAGRKKDTVASVESAARAGNTRQPGAAPAEQPDNVQAAAASDGSGDSAAASPAGSSAAQQGEGRQPQEAQPSQPGAAPAEQPDNTQAAAASDGSGDSAAASSADSSAAQQGEGWGPKEAQRQLELLRLELEQKAADTRDTMLRQIAQARNDLAETRQRTEKELERLRRYAVQDIVSQLLPVLDDLEMAIAEARRDGADVKALTEGVELIQRKVLEIFSGFSIRREYPEGSIFDPNLHEAVSIVEGGDAEPNTVLEVLQSGYQLHDRLLRPARVVVAKGGILPGEEDERTM